MSETNSVSNIPIELALPFKAVIGSPVTALPFDVQIAIMLEWADKCKSRFVCVANVHMLMEAYWHSKFAGVLKNADLVTPDGMPLVWMLRLMGAQKQDRVAGMDILLTLCRLAPTTNISVFFLGSQTMILERIKVKLKQEIPNLKIAGMEPLPFQPLSQAENDAVVQKINKSGAGLVFVSLGCPKQEYWISQNKGKISAVMIGLGGAFPVYAGIHKRAPRWVRELGLEWAYRLAQEPRRLWNRYTRTNLTFIYLALKQLAISLLGHKYVMHECEEHEVS
jgi:N-acetylglucosaminyldiphosphoundecaprenol N-acetyl-beta-D-mannosaminyltransferase